MNGNTLKLEAGETLLKVIHRHWLTLFTQLFVLGIFALLPVIGWLIVLMGQHAAAPVTLTVTSYTGHVVFFYFTWLLFVWMALANTLLNHYLDVFAITNKRIISIDQRGFFHRHMGSFRLEKLQDVNVDVHGIIATLFDYGTLEVETASGSDGEFRAHHLPNPRELKNLILETSQQFSQPS
jgi:uncharacterized membrane protein YdbT with pleckstrin-like domain